MSCQGDSICDKIISWKIVSLNFTLAKMFFIKKVFASILAYKWQ